MNIYLAGPDVFRPDAADWAAEARRLVASFGHSALLPTDNEAPDAPGIFAGNMALLRRADAVLANLEPFRGGEPDSGTCVEVGCAIALGKPVVGYLRDTRPLVERIGATRRPGSGNAFVDERGWTVENFGLPLNLMLAVPCTVVEGGLAGALARLQRDAG